jgi:molecular chaperone GrpE
MSVIRRFALWLLRLTGQEGPAPPEYEAVNPPPEREPVAPVRVAAAQPPPDVPQAADGDRSREERDRLVEICLTIADQTASGMLREQVEDALEEVGVIAFSADGERFDPSRHEAAGVTPTDDPEREGLVAETERPGYLDGDEVIRPARVVVWRGSAA